MLQYGIFVFFAAVINFSDANFSINYEKNSFYLDGKPFRYVSGSAHYFRVPHQYWRDRLRKMRAGGLNAVSTYVEWSQHEPVPGEYHFSGDLDLVKFIRLAQEEGLYVILRPGPYICAERDMGGLPYWLLNKHPKIVLRSSDPKYTEYVERWMNVLLPKISPLLFGNGGPIILVQVENEYGFYHACDHNYNLWLRDLFKRHVRDKAVLFTTDSPSDRVMKCGKIPDVYATVDFGPEINVQNAFSMQRKYEPRGPLVNSEYYPGWLTHWGEKMARKDAKTVVETLKKMLSMGANVNFYMYFGGTNFGFTAGANYNKMYVSDITSYDYDAPISEAGDLTPKFYALKEAIAEYLPTPSNSSAGTSEKGDYGELSLKVVASMMSPLVRSSLGIFHRNKYPLTFEELDHNSGYMLYETELRKNLTTPVEYVVKSYNDFANVYIDGNFLTSLSREKQQNAFTVQKSSPGQVLSIMVENLGRINFDSLINERKGLLSNVTRKMAVLDTWNMTSFELKTMKPVEKCFDSFDGGCNNGQGFFIYMGRFAVAANASKGDEGYLLDSFLDVTNLTKGLVYINDFNLGRYWSTRGPQYTLYVPGVYIKKFPEKNTLIVIDENIRSESIKVKFTKNPIFSY
ncbi:UNVERIFIED_CONTAM: hypothetical protein PYX00_008749 [Menopon gallinae]|uniref:Beta-galactosidase n=1 Tax=Menopon gallinae TaxID=328185 RepID=A0AAW2HPH5_9NEOP